MVQPKAEGGDDEPVANGLALIDTTSSGGYTLSGNDFCAPNTPPVATLQASPTSGFAPHMANGAFAGRRCRLPDQRSVPLAPSGSGVL